MISLEIEPELHVHVHVHVHTARRHGCNQRCTGTCTPIHLRTRTRTLPPTGRARTPATLPRSKGTLTQLFRLNCHPVQPWCWCCSQVRHQCSCKHVHVFSEDEIFRSCCVVLEARGHHKPPYRDGVCKHAAGCSGCRRSFAHACIWVCIQQCLCQRVRVHVQVMLVPRRQNIPAWGGWDGWQCKVGVLRVGCCVLAMMWCR